MKDSGESGCSLLVWGYILGSLLVDRKTGVKLPGGLEPKGELDCHQLADSFQE